MSVNPSQRHKRRNPCPICGGGDDMPRGHEKRCHGFTSDDGEWIHCSREEHAFGIDPDNAGTFAHRFHGPCRCGTTHNEAPSGVIPKSDGVAAAYNYRDERGNLIFQVVRLAGPKKEFRQRRPDGDRWIWQTSGIRRVLYRLPELLAADKSKPVFVCEGEKDADTLARLGHVSTTNPNGAGKWGFVEAEAKKVLAGRPVIVIADADAVGRAHAQQVADSLTGLATSVRIIEPSPCKDITDYISEGRPLEDLLVMPMPVGFRFKWADEMAKPLPPVEWLCHGYSLPRGCYGLIAGESYSGKSLWISDLALAIASGRPAVDIHRTKRGKVLWLDYDGQGARITYTRFRRLAQASGFDLAEVGDQLGYSWLPDHHLDDPDALDVFSRIFEGVTFAVIDSWRGAAPNTEEKDRAAVQKVGNTLLKVIERTGVTTLIVDHTSKPAREGKSTRSSMHDIHGSTAKAELAQWVVMFEKQEGEPVKVKHLKERMEDRRMSPFCLRYEDVARDNDPRWGLRVVHLDREQIESNSGDLLDKSKERILQTMRSTGRDYQSANQLAYAVGGTRGLVLEAVRQLLESGELAQPGGSGGPIRLGQRSEPVSYRKNRAPYHLGNSER